MLIKNLKKGKKEIRHNRLWLYVAIGALIGGSLLFAWWFAQDGSPESQEVIATDMERVQDGFFLGTGAYKFKGGDTQTGEAARSGHHSSRAGIGKGFQYGVNFDFTHFKLKTTYCASVWRYTLQPDNSGTLVVAADDGSEFYRSSNTAIATEHTGWEKLEVCFTTPERSGIWQKLNIHTYANGRRNVYFDDLKIEPFTADTNANFNPPTLHFKLNSNAYNKLLSIRQAAMQAGILEVGDDDWVNAQLNTQGQKLPVKMRLKGDWLDHLKDNKWSFRVKLRSDHVWKRIVTFSLHRPEARQFLFEWVFHQMLEQEDVLTTRYDFVKVLTNERDLGIYVCEEHFEKQLLEYRNRREGPIVKFSESGFWANFKRLYQDLGYLSHDVNASIRHGEFALIEPFNEKTILGDSTQYRYFLQAQDRMAAYMSGTQPASYLFDLEKLSRYLAICDALGATHGLAWHNQRFYFNPITAKLEPIGFDGYDHSPGPRYNFIGQGAAHPDKFTGSALLPLLFRDTSFTAKYVKALFHYTSKDFLNTFFKKIEPALTARLRYLKSEYPDVDYNMSKMIDYAQFAHVQVLPFSQSLRVHEQRIMGDKKMVRVQNGHHLPIEVVGYGWDKTAAQSNLKYPQYIPPAVPREAALKYFHPLSQDSTLTGEKKYQALRALARHLPDKRATSMAVPATARYLYVKVPGLDSLIATPIRPWSAPRPDFETGGGNTLAILVEQDIAQVFDKTVIFKKGIFKIDFPIEIPAGYEVSLPAGLSLDLVNGGYFHAAGPVMARGSEQYPVIIKSSDGTGGGFSVFNAPLPSTLGYVYFQNLGLSESMRNMTGAVTFYESQTELYNCIFTNNRSEDGLNIIRSTFKMENCLVQEAPSDGFDCDFCKGEVLNSHFKNTANDGFDVSGSVIRIADCRMENNGDKGISVGEDSEVYVFNTTIANANIAVASKDLSTLFMQDVHIKDCQQGFTAYQKKPEYGPAAISVNNYTAQNVKKLYQAGPGSTIKLEGAD